MIRHIQVIAIAALLTLPLQTIAGGFPVIDVANLTQTQLSAARALQQYQQMVEAYQTQLEQLQQAAQQLDAMTGTNTFGDLYNSGKYRDARRYVPSTWEDTMRILEAGGLPGSARDVYEIYDRISKDSNLLTRDQYNAINQDSPNAKAFERRANTNTASMAVSERSFNQSHLRMAVYEEMMQAINSAPDLKTISDLSARINAENGTALAELIRLKAVQLQQAASVQHQHLVDESNMKAMTRFQNYPINNIPTH